MHLIDLEQQSVQRLLNWNTPDIEWHGHGGDRGLRGIAFDGDIVYIAASDRLLAFSPEMELLDSWRNPYLKHCEDIAVWKRTLYITSSAYDSVVGFDLDERRFHWALHVRSARYQYGVKVYDPMSDEGPLQFEKLRLSSLHCNQHGMYLCGLKTGGMLHFNGKAVNMAVQLPSLTHNTRPFRDGVLFNDNEDDVVRYTERGEGTEDRGMALPDLDTSTMDHTEAIEDGITRPGFARGLCVLNDRIVAGGSSPATITLYDLAANETLGYVNFSNDVRSTIHSIAEWPFER